MCLSLAAKKMETVCSSEMLASTYKVTSSAAIKIDALCSSKKLGSTCKYSTSQPRILTFPYSNIVKVVWIFIVTWVWVPIQELCWFFLCSLPPNPHPWACAKVTLQEFFMKQVSPFEVWGSRDSESVSHNFVDWWAPLKLCSITTDGVISGLIHMNLN